MNAQLLASRVVDVAACIPDPSGEALQRFDVVHGHDVPMYDDVQFVRLTTDPDSYIQIEALFDQSEPLS